MTDPGHPSASAAHATSTAAGSDAAPEPARAAEPPPDHPDRGDVVAPRIGAALVDLVLLAGLFLILGFTVGDGRVGGGGLDVTLRDGWLLLFGALAFLYYFVLEATTGQTVGKRLGGVRVVSTDGGRPPAWRIAGRTLLRAVDVLPAMYLVGFVTMLATGSRRQRIGDLAAGTVIARARPGRRRSLALVPLVLVLLAVIGLAGYRADRPDAEVTTPAAALATPVPTTPTPTPTGPGPLTFEEKAWLAAIPTFMKKVEREFEPDNLHLTSRKLREFAAVYRDCRPDLARDRPGKRLLSVFRLVLRACAEYDKGAKCFATAAGILAPAYGSAAERARNRAVDCGFAADLKGGEMLAEAFNDGEKIKIAAQD